MTIKISWKRVAGAAGAVLLACLLVACGGSSGGPGGSCVNVDPTRSSALPGCGSTTSAGSGTESSSTGLTLDVVDSTGAASTNLMPDNPFTLKTVLKNSSGAAVPNAVVTFSTTDNSGVFSPSSGTAMTDANGAASVKLSAGTQAGAFTVTASAGSGSTAARSSKNYTVSFPVLTLSDMQLSPSTLPAGSNASVTISVLNNGKPYTQPVSVAFNSSCVQAGKASIGTPVLTQNGTAVASYTDKGCNNSDTLTATVTLPNATLTKSAVLTVLPSAAGSLKFVAAQPTNIALVGTGGVDRPESSVVRFQVLDNNGNPVVGRLVTFEFGDTGTTTTTGGLKLTPTSATTAQDGTVTTAVGGGTIPTSIRVVAKVSGTDLSTISSLLVVSSGVPDQNHFSLSAEVGNCEGWSYDMGCTIIRAIVGDHFSNAVPDGTAVNFTTEGGVIEPSCLTVAGTCTVKLWSSNPRPAGGRATVLAYVLGEETFNDTNGNNVFNDGEPYIEKSPDIFRDDDENGVWSPGEPCIGPNRTGSCNTPGNGRYDGVLNRASNRQPPETLYVSQQLVTMFSTSFANITIEPAAISCPSGSTDVRVTVKDQNNLWMPVGTLISFSALYGQVSTPTIPAGQKVPSVALAVGAPANVPTYVVTVPCQAGQGSFVVTVTTPFNNVTVGKAPIN
ncbi:MAG TPA: Ig-like domain-containing protein [Pseudoduganella sp.]